MLSLLVFFVHGYRWGERIRGDERRFLELAKRFKEAGLRLYVVEHAPSMQKAYYGKPMYYSLEIPSLYGYSNYTSLMRMLYTLSFVIRVCLKFRRRIDIIYAHNQDVSNLVPALIAKAIIRKPLIIVLHSLQDFNFSFKELLKMYRGSILDSLLILSQRVIGRLILKLADMVFTVSHTVRKEAEKSLNIKRIVVTGNGVDTNKFRPLKLEKKYHAVFCGRIDFAQKGIDMLLKAWKTIVSNLPSAKLLLIGGFQDKHNQGLLKKFVEVLKLRDNIIITGFLPDEKLVELLNESNIFILISRFEGFGLSVLEAMSCGLPCIVSDIPVFKELHDGIAIFSSQESTKDLVNEVFKILSDRTRYERLSFFSRIHALKFSWQVIADKEVTIIRTIAKRYSKLR